MYMTILVKIYEMREYFLNVINLKERMSLNTTS